MRLFFQGAFSLFFSFVPGSFQSSRPRTTPHRGRAGLGFQPTWREIRWGRGWIGDGEGNDGVKQAGKISRRQRKRRGEGGAIGRSIGRAETHRTQKHQVSDANVNPNSRGPSIPFHSLRGSRRIDR
ncbi:hypothetical protein IWZ00DRAFT_272966 [Phyllosticta capitalensis]|uniref:Secreted protein n=1 Tax=Phyllosticta capitalensis TaxID=121624 RepID=A0ABR1YPC7_9PEZI